MSFPGHVMILASAGSGKTYALTNRYVRLLAGGAAPERIVALTFTRKAAGEFFDEILHKLAGASADAPAARKLAQEIGLPGLGSTDFLRLLRTVVEAMPRLSLGTLDGFFARIVRSFPLELGLGGEFMLLEETAARAERRRVLQRLFAAAGEPGAAQKEFIEAFKRATFGAEEKQLARWLDAFLDEHAEAYLDAPQAGSWGDPRRIWPDGTEWLDADGDRAAAVRTLRAALPWATLNDAQRRRLEDFFAALPAWQPGAVLPKPVDYLVKNALAVWPELRAGRAELTLERKKIPLNPDAGAALATVVRSIVGAELARKLEMTRGLFAVLHGYESVYHAAVRRAGRLTFADVQRLLLPAAGAPVLTGDDAGDGRLLIDWRLDAQFDHWLLDEFQDTSFAQWSVLRNLIDEAVQDPEGRRSFLYVGDVKQAIFAWREGDPRLFREIFNHYNAEPGAGVITEQHLTTSYRSGPAVITMVNRVFGDAPAIRGLVPAEAESRWSGEWRTHTSAKPGLGGHAELRHAADEAGRFAETLRILQEVEPARRGLTVAVLVQKNDTGARLADYLRRAGNLRAVAESDLRIATDNPLTCGLLALVRLAAHPGDTQAREHLAMTPLGAVLASAGLDTPEKFTAGLLGQLQAGGFAAVLEHWLRVLEPHLEKTDDFSRLRGRQLVGAARKFDEGGRRNIAEFLAWAEGCTVRDADTAGVVRVMTIHKAKGQGFDLVILPDLEGQTLAQRRSGLAVQKTSDRAVEWVLELPAKIFYERDEVLRGHVAAKESDAAYEALCMLYVAMTRAKRAMYVITQPVGTSSSRNFPRLLEQTLGETWAAGEPDWYSTLKPMEIQPAGREESDWSWGPDAERGLRLASRRPSDAKPGVRLVSLFGPEGAAADFGTGVHALFETVEWWQPEQAAVWRAAQTIAGTDPLALTETYACLTSLDLAPLFVRPRDRAEVWRERAFEVVLDGVWYTGVFDRVVVEFDDAGRAAQATVIDFKTDRPRAGETIERAAEKHAAQLTLYRRAVAVLTGLPGNKVACILMMSAWRSSVAVPWQA